MTRKNKKGFTLIELLIVIAIIAILASIIFVAVDPAKRGRQSRDTRRWSEANSILNAVLNYGVDNKVSNYESAMGITTAKQQLGTATTGCATTGTASGTCSGVADNGCLDLTADFPAGYLVDTYIAKIPLDPKYGTSGKTGYYIQRTSPGDRIKVGACMQEQPDGDIVEVSR